jgi:hypothetical protein
MASNVDKVAEKVEDDLEEATKTSKSRKEFERKMDTRDVSHKLKDETKEGKQKPYETNQ